MDDKYDVVIYGAQEGKDRGEVAAAIAKSFSLDLQKAERLITRANGAVVSKGLTKEDADRITQVLSRLGAKANWRPTSLSGATLELVPKEAKVSKHVCPECGFSVEIREGEKAPDVCTRCGLVFWKYEDVKRRKREEEKIRSKLKRADEMRTEAELKEQAQKEESQRQKALEERIRRELGIPAAVNKKWKLWSIAAATLIVGVGLGISGASLFSEEEAPADQASHSNEHAGPADTSPLAATIALAAASRDMLAAAATASGVAPAMLSAVAGQSMGQLMALSDEVLEQTAAPTLLTAPGAAKSGVVPPGATNGADSLPASPEATATSTFDLATLETLMIEDTDWNRFVVGKARQALDAGDAGLARRLARQIPAPAMRLSTFGQIAAELARNGDREAAMMLDLLLEDAEAIPSAAARVDAVADVAANLSGPKARPGGLRLLMTAKDWTAAIESETEQAEAWAKIGAAQAALGLPDDAHESMRRASTGLAGPLPVEAYVRIASELAIGFHRLSDQETAADLLHRSTDGLAHLSAPHVRDRTVRAIATAWAEIGEMERAIDASEGLTSPAGRDAFLFELIESQVLAGRRLELDAIAELLQTSEWKAQAFSLLGAVSTASEIARKHFASAIVSTEELPEGLSGDAVRAAVARVLTRSGYRQTGMKLFERIEQTLATRESEGERDIGWAILAGNWARALKPARAEQYVGRQKDGEIRAFTSADLARVTVAIDLL